MKPAIEKAFDIDALFYPSSPNGISWEQSTPSRPEKVLSRLPGGEFFPGQVSGRVLEHEPAALAIVGDAQRQTIPLQLEISDVVLAALVGDDGAFQVVNHDMILG